MIENFFLLNIDTNDVYGEKLFIRRAKKYFSQTLENSVLHAFGAATISYILILYAADIQNIIMWFVQILLFSILMLVFNIQQVKKRSVEEIKSFLLIRIIIGICLAITYPLSLFIIPSGADDIVIVMLVALLYAINSIIMISQLTFPDFYFTFTVGLLVTLGAFLAINFSALALIIISVLAVGVVLILPKYIALSKIAIKDMQQQAKLERENEDLNALKEQITELTFTDDLTQLPNKKYLQEAFSLFADSNNLDTQYFSLITLNLDNFKKVNHINGYGYGDQILKTIGDRLGKLIEEPDVVGRLRCDEFCLIIQTSRKDHLKGLIDEINKTIQIPIGLEGESTVVIASHGIAEFPLDGKTFDELLSRADKRMFMRKKIM